MDEPIPITESSGNVFADLGLPNPDELLAKSELARRIGEIVAERGLSQSRAAREIGIDQPTLSRIVRGRLAGFSLERLAGYLNRLDEVVEIRTYPNPRPSHPARTIAHAHDGCAIAASSGSATERARFD
jgi:predicted XRE-type DNA-binding protein